MSKIKILIVEDESIIALNLKETLYELGYEPCGISPNRCKTIALLESGVEPDLILMDINLPDMSGLETTRCIKAQGVNTEIVALTGNAYEEDKLKTKEAGMSYHLVKPVMYHELNNVIKLALRVVH